MKKIIHFSDLHIGYKNLGDRFQIIVENLVVVKQPASDYVILITGDLVDDATVPSNYSLAHRSIEKLEREGYEVLVIPGNHDYGTGADASRDFVARFKQEFYGTLNVVYPKVDVIGSIAFLGLDSMAEEVNWYDQLGAEGELGEAQLKRLGERLKDDHVRACEKRVVYLHHHPFDPRFVHELKDAKKLEAVLKENGNVDALLYGHNHEGKKRNGLWKIPRCYDAGSSTRKNDAPGDHRVIDLTRDARLDYDGDFHGNL